MTRRLSVFDRLTGARPDLIPASEYTIDQLARIYSEARSDYIVPMPMNGRRLREYVRYYDVDLDASFVSVSAEGDETGIAMLGLRERRAWLTRIGVNAKWRGHHYGFRLVEASLEAARDAGSDLAQLEVIEGNLPAQRLFTRFGFAEHRRLLVLVRPPMPVAPVTAVYETDIMDADRIDDCLDSRRDSPSWIEESASLRNSGGMHGIRIKLADGRRGWIVYVAAAFQLSHFAIDAPDAEVAYLLLHALHKQHAQMDTKVENLPADSPYLEAFQYAGYVESFRRIEMLMRL